MAKLGDTWDKDTDYQAIIDNAVSKGDYMTAAKAEQLRNEKIDATGSSYSKTNNYSGWLDTTDYGTIGKNQMSSGADWRDVLDTYNNRYDKAANTVGLTQYANDDLQQAMAMYIQNKQALENSQNAQNELMSQLNAILNQKPTYEEKYNPEIDAILNEILNREDFSYDASNDPLYQQYEQMYRREGDRAMRETMAEAAAGAGGMNSYAITAAQQANNYYNAQLGDKIPELYQLAYEMYLTDKESKVQDLGILQDMNATQYNRYRDTMSDWRNDVNFAYGMYQDAVDQGNWQQSFDYNAMVDNRDFNYNDTWQNKQWDAQQGQIQIENDRYDKETARAEVEYYISLGVMPDADLIAKAGMNAANVSAAVEAVKAEQVSKGGKTSGGSTGGTVDDTKYGYYEDDEVDNPIVEPEINSIGLGLGPISDERLLELAKYNLVIIGKDGSVKWADGVNKNNYESFLPKSVIGLF